VGVRRYLVRYAVDAGTTIPSGTSPYGDQRPALYVTGAGVDAPRTFDTTGTDGSTSARLRVVPTLLTRAALPDSAEVRVTATALVSGGRGPVPVASPVIFAVRLIRLTPPGSACP
jgi:hypothetical protein